MFEVISANQKQKWDELVCSMPGYDFYSFNEYHQLDTCGTPMLLHYKDKEADILFPVIVREITGTSYKDITSVYGYSGPLASKTPISKTSKEDFQKELLRFFDTENIVSAFSRLHPLFNHQAELLNGLGQILEKNTTLAINLESTLSEQRKSYSHSLKYDINRNQRAGTIIRKANQKEEIDQFIRIYYHNMDRVGASPFYYFPEAYFYSLLKINGAELIIAEQNNEIIAGTILFKCKHIIQAHLSASKKEYLDLSPVKYLWYEISKTGKDEGYKYFHLGGGFGGKDDKLFEFKSHFTKQKYKFTIWQYIHNKDAYNTLISENKVVKYIDSSFFPLYRAT